MDAKELLDSLTTENIIQLLVELGAQHINDLSESKGHIITNTICHNISDGSMKLYYYTEGNGKFEGKKFHCFTACGESFNIFELVKKNFELKRIELRFNEVIGWICDKLGIQRKGYSKPEGFGHHEEKVNEELEYLKRFDKKEIIVPELKIYDECILKRFSNHHHQSFLEDNISHEAMTKYNIMFDYVNHGVVIPHKDMNSNLIGLKVRNLSEESIAKGYKYVPFQTFGKDGVLYSYPTHFNLYGLRENKDYIKKISKAIIFESEKSVLQLATYYSDCSYAVALCGSSMSQYQIDVLLSMNLREITIALDKEYEDINDEKGKIYQEKIKRLGLQLAPYTKVTVLVDTEGLLNYKDSPSDQGVEVLERLLANKKIINLIEE